MAEGNGRAEDMRQRVAFTIGGEQIEVPSLVFWDLDELKTEIQSLEPATHWVDYAANVLKIVAHQLAPERPELTFEALKRRCSISESIALAGQMNELLWASGFPRPVPATEPANLGTGTSIGSALDSQRAELAEGTHSS